MSLTRINPLQNLNKTADDLAIFIVHGRHEELMQCLLTAKEIYRGPVDSWLTGIFYRIMNSRTRFPRLDKIITEVLGGSGVDNSGKIIDIFSEGGWKETSYNTVLIRTLVQQLQDYDSTIQLSLEAVIELKVLLIFAQARLLNQDNLCKQQAALNALKAKENEMHNDLTEMARLLREYDVRRTQIQKDEQLTDARLQELENMCGQQEQTLSQYQQQLRELDTEKKKQEEELERNRLLAALNEKMDLNKLTSAQREEAIRIAMTSINMYMKDIETQDHEKAELSIVTAGKVGQATSLLADNGLFKRDTAARQAELNAISATGSIDNNFKQKLAALLGSRAVPAKKPVRNEELAKLYSTGQRVKAHTNLAAIAVVDDYKPEEEAISFSAAKQAVALLFARRAPQAAPVVESEPVVKQSI